jgi:proton-dependent oligopeptide transporter, POT family
MATQASNLDSTVLDSSKDTSGIGGHPRGLTTLYFTEMWERFSYYGMRALLTLYMTKALGYDDKVAGSIYGAYTGSVWLMSLPGGWIADNVLGSRNAVLVGGIIIALGHYSMALPMTWSFFLGLILIVLGTGLLKPNVSAIVGDLYSQNDQRRDAGFSIFYMGINLGAFLAPLICSPLGEKISWHLGFAVAGVGMTLGVIQYVAGRNRLAHVGHAPVQSRGETRRKALIGALLLAIIGAVVIFIYFGPKIVTDNRNSILIGSLILFLTWLFPAYLKPGERKPVAVIVILFVFAVIFWAVFEQAGSSFTLFAERFTNRVVFGYEFPTGWYQILNSGFLFVLAPVFAWLWIKMGDRQPSSPAKFSFGLVFVGLGAVLLVIASLLLGSADKVGPGWMVGVYFCHTVGELCLSPVGLSTTTKLAPQRMGGLMMGLWFLSISFGSFFGGEIAGSFKNDPGELARLFLKVAAVPFIAGLILAALTPSIKKLMGKVR